MIPVDELEDYPKRTKSRRRALLYSGVVAALGVLAFALLSPARDVPTEAPEFNLPLLGGGTLSDGDLRGAPVVLNFWASWCTPCREEAELLERVWQRYRDRGVQVVGVNVQDSEEGAQEFVDEFSITYSVVLDHSNDLARPLGVNGLPQTFFIDEDYRFSGRAAGEALGESRDTVVLGAISEEELIEQIEAMLAD